MPQLQVPATEVQVGDKVLHLPEHDSIVREIKRRPGHPQGVEVDSLGGWVSLAGDSEDGYFQRFYEDEQDYYAYPLEMITVERTGS